MKKVIKLSIFALVGLLLLLVLAVVIAVNVVDLNNYKGQIEDLVTQQVGREVRISGDVGFSLFPWIGVDIEDVSLANKQDFARKYLGRVQSLGVEVKLWPLLFKEIQVGTVKVDGLTLNLTKKEDGEANWEGLGKKKEFVNATKSAKEKKEPASIPDFSVRQVEVGKGTVHWVDKSSNTELLLQDFHLAAGPVKLGEFCPFEFSFALDNKEPKVALTAQGSGRLLAELDKEKYTLRDFKLDSSFQGEAVPAGKAA